MKNELKNISAKVHSVRSLITMNAELKKIRAKVQSVRSHEEEALEDPCQGSVNKITMKKKLKKIRVKVQSVR